MLETLLIFFLKLHAVMCGNLLSSSDIYFEVDNDDALLESIMGDDKTAVTIITPFFYPVFALVSEFLSSLYTEFLFWMMVHGCSMLS